MYQSGYQYRDGSAPPKFSHPIQMISLAILYVSFFSCLIRSDFNFPIIFFVYFIWQQRKDALALKLMLASVIVVIVFDILFLFTQMRVWIQQDTNNPIWQTIRPMHNFGIFTFALIMVLKIVLIVFIGRSISNMNQAVHPV